MNEGCEVSVALLEEGTDVWRTVVAERVGPALFRLIGPVPEGESWEFLPGEVVRCEERVFAGGLRGLVAVESSRG